MNADDLNLEELTHIELLVQLGETALSRVYKGFDDRLKRTVAVKLLDPRLVPDPDQVERFIREAQVAAGLRHPNIVAVHEIGVIQGEYAIVMEYLEGGDLSVRLGLLNLESRLSVVRQMALALSYAHQKGVVHRDLKPQNVMFDAFGTAKMVDFGIAKAFGQSKLTQDKTFLGTPHYASPEQARGDEVDGRSDLYSLGVLLFHLVCGRLPYTADEPLALLYQHVNHPIPAISSVDWAIPDYVVRLIRRLMQKDAQARLQTAQEVVDVLDHALLDEDEMLPASPYKKYWLVGGIVFALLVVLGWIISRPKTPSLKPPAPTVELATPTVEIPVVADESAKDRQLVKEHLDELGFVAIPVGIYKMGTKIHRQNDARHVHEVYVSSFELGRTEVTQALWLAVMGTQPACSPQWADHPVENVSYQDVTTFLLRLNALALGHYRLPTEAEWEYAARAGQKGRSDVFQSDRALGDEAWFADNSNDQSQPVGRKKPNDWGLYDMKGNVWEWCADWYAENYYEHSPYDDPQGPASGQFRVVRGGAYNSPGSDCRSTNRFKWEPGKSSCRIGFRLLRFVPEDK